MGYNFDSPLCDLCDDLSVCYLRQKLSKMVTTYVYLVDWGTERKIGISKTPEKRIAGLYGPNKRFCVFGPYTRKLARKLEGCVKTHFRPIDYRSETFSASYQKILSFITGILPGRDERIIGERLNEIYADLRNTYLPDAKGLPISLRRIERTGEVTFEDIDGICDICGSRYPWETMEIPSDSMESIEEAFCVIAEFLAKTEETYNSAMGYCKEFCEAPYIRGLLWGDSTGLLDLI